MSQHHVQGLIKTSTLNEHQLQAIQELATLCNNFEHLRMRIGWEMLRSRKGDEVNDYLYYVDGRLAGYFGLDDYGKEDKEAVAMVHPDLRRKGIFTALLNSAKEECWQHGVKELILISEQKSPSGIACAQALNLKLDFAEHEMVLGTFIQHHAIDERLTVRSADDNDFDALVTVLSASFDDPVEKTQQRVRHIMQRPNSQQYLAIFGEKSLGCEEPVGTLRLDEIDEEIGIYALGIVPAYRGRGYGRQMLEEVIYMTQARSQKPIMLDVQTDNTPAVNLYRSVGFEIRTTYNYYSLPLQNS